jgi:hypothetical protein
MFEFFEKIAEGIGFKLIDNLSDKIVEFFKDVKENAENKDDENKVATSGDGSQVATSGNDSKVATSGYYSKVATSGNDSKVATSGDGSQVATSGYYSQVATSGDYSKVATSGDGSQVATSGRCSKIATSGDYSQVATSGDYSQVEISGNNSVGFACGLDSIIKAKKGTWISLCEYEENDEGRWIPKFALSAQIGNKDYKDARGKILKETEFYALHNKKFYPIDFSDGIQTMKVSEKVRDGITIIKGIDFQDYDEIYIAKEGELSAHGNTLREAIDDLTFKKMKDVNIDDIVKEIKEKGKVTRSQYRLITGACSFGTNQFCKQHGIQDLEEIELTELRKILIDDYGAEKFWKVIDE